MRDNNDILRLPTLEVSMKIEKLYPVCKSYIWGGTRLKEKYGKTSDSPTVAESWELSFHKDGESRISTGELLSAAVGEGIGRNASEFDTFPILVKLIDARDDLSVQVHPSDEYALANEGENGKTEMWYIVEADEGAGIYLGFSEDVSEADLRTAISENRLTELLNFYPVSAGESYFIPSGTIHAIGKGCLICEIQQNSNITYRVYDYGRVDANGKGRELHVEKALQVADRSKFQKRAFPKGILSACKYFTARKISTSSMITVNVDEGSFLSLTCTRGEGVIGGEQARAGDSFFVPAGYGEVKISGNIELVSAEIRKYYIDIECGADGVYGALSDDIGKTITSKSIAVADSARTVNAYAELVGELLQSAGFCISDISDVRIKEADGLSKMPLNIL